MRGCNRCGGRPNWKARDCAAVRLRLLRPPRWWWWGSVVGGGRQAAANLSRPSRRRGSPILCLALVLGEVRVRRGRDRCPLPAAVPYSGRAPRDPLRPPTNGHAAPVGSPREGRFRRGSGVCVCARRGSGSGEGALRGASPMPDATSGQSGRATWWAAAVFFNPPPTRTGVTHEAATSRRVAAVGRAAGGWDTPTPRHGTRRSAGRLWCGWMVVRGGGGLVRRLRGSSVPTGSGVTWACPF